MRYGKECQPSWANNGRMENHCLALLGHVTEHPTGRQSYAILSDACGIPEGSLKAILSFHRNHGTCRDAKTCCYLCKTALKYGFAVGMNGERLTATKNSELVSAEDIERSNATLAHDYPSKCPECGARVVIDRNGEPVCAGCGLCFEGG